MLYTFLDLETTGLDHEKDQMIEYGVIMWDSKSPNKSSSIQGYVRLEEGRILSKEIIKLTGITEEKLKKGVSIKEAEERIADFIKDTIVVIHFASFDLGFLKNIYVPEFYCTRTLSKIIFPEENASLIPTCKRLGISKTNHHSALDDARATRELFKYYLENYDIKEFKNLMYESEERPLKYIPDNAQIYKPV